MVIAAPSCRAATKDAPAATSAFVTAKLPLPIRPETCRTPSSASVSPTASATRTLGVRDQGEGPSRASRPADDGEWRHEEEGAGGGQPAEPDQGGQAVLPGAVQEVVAGEGRVESARHPGVGADRLNAEADDRRLEGQPAGALRRGAGSVGASLVDVEKRGLVARPALPAGAEEQPAAFRQRAGLPLPRHQLLDLHEEV